jgi:hypothetical protein
MKIDFLPAQYQFSELPGLEWAVVSLIVAVSLIICFMWMRTMFQRLLDEITRLSDVSANLSAHIENLTRERNALRDEILGLQGKLEEFRCGIVEAEASLRTRVDAVAALVPESTQRLQVVKA